MGSAFVTVNPVKNDNSIQILRGLAIIAVVIIHSCPGGLFGVFLRPFVNYAVAMFLFLSGYLTKKEINNKKSFIFKRLKKVIIPYCIWSVIYMIPEGFENFIIKFITGRCSVVFYYIFVYIQFVILTPLITKLIKSKYKMLGWFITPLCTVIFRYIFTLSGVDILSSNYHYLFLAWFIYYYLGLYLGNDIKTLTPPKWIYAVLFAATVTVSVAEGLVWYYFNNYDMATTQLRLTSIGTSLACIAIAYHFIKTKKEFSFKPVNKALILLGNASFGIYLSHMLIKTLLSMLPIWKYFVFPLSTIVILVLSVICVVIGKKFLYEFSWVLGL